MDKKIIEQNIVSKKTDEGYYVEVFNDGKLVWTDTFETEEHLEWFIRNCNERKHRDKLNLPNDVFLSQDEGRKMLENNEYSVAVFYRQPKGNRFASIYHNDVFPNSKKHGFSVFIVNKDNFLKGINVSTIDEVFQVIKDVEDGKI